MLSPSADSSSAVTRASGRRTLIADTACTRLSGFVSRTPCSSTVQALSPGGLAKQTGGGKENSEKSHTGSSHRKRARPFRCYNQIMRFPAIAILLRSPVALRSATDRFPALHPRPRSPRPWTAPCSPAKISTQYACGNWITDNPIPADQPRWDVYSKLQYENQLFLWGLLRQAGNTDAPRTPEAQKIGDLFPRLHG